MKNSLCRRIIALDVRAQMFGFAVFEGEEQILEWGTRSFRCGKRRVKVPMRQKLLGLLNEFKPELLILQESKHGATGKSVKLVLNLARRLKIPVLRIPRVVLQRSFQDHNHNKHEIATVVANRFPQLAQRLPRKRMPWQSEDARMSIFDAAALGVTYFDAQE
jgi:hypothetical protein